MKNSKRDLACKFSVGIIVFCSFMLLLTYVSVNGIHTLSLSIAEKWGLWFRKSIVFFVLIIAGIFGYHFGKKLPDDE